MEIVKIAAIVIASYLIGSFNMAILYTRRVCKCDVREKGSQNAGATNVARVFGVKAGVLTLLGDFVKTGLCLLVGRFLMGYNGVLIAAMACTVGHCWPIYYGFRGGKGVAVGAAIALLLYPRAFGVMLTTFLLMFLLTRKVSACSLAAAVMFPLSLVIFGVKDTLTLVCALFVAVIVWVMHRGNLKRLSAGTEPEFSFGGKKNKRSVDGKEES
jgi:glycerol-3-phosphate acyltransferase PlsY